MAFVPNQDFNDNDQEAPSIQETGSTGATLGAGAAPSQQTQQPQQQGTGFTNLTRYLDQNQQQSAQMADSISGNIGQVGDTAREGISDAENKFNQQADQSTINFDQDVFNQVNQNATQVANNQDLFNQVVQQRDAEYKGPSDLESSDFYKPAQDVINQAHSTGQKVASDEGRKELSSALNTGQTTAGMSSIDNFLLGGSSTNRETLFNAREGLSDLDSRLSQANQSAQERASQVAQTNLQTREQAQKALDQSMGNFRQDIDTRTQQTQQQAQQQYDELMSAISSGRELTPEQQQLAGFTPAEYSAFKQQQEQYRNMGNQISGQFGTEVANPTVEQRMNQRAVANTVNAANQKASAAEAQRQALLNAANNMNPIAYENYIRATDPSLTINRNNAATAEDYARQQALLQLMYGSPDQEFSVSNDQMYITNPELAGTADLNIIDFDRGGLSSAYGQSISNVSRQQAAFEQALRDAEKARDNIRYTSTRTGGDGSRAGSNSGMGGGSTGGRAGGAAGGGVGGGGF